MEIVENIWSLTDNLGSKNLQSARADKNTNKKGSMNELIGAFEMN